MTSKLSFEEIRQMWSERANNDTIDIRNKDHYWDDFEKNTLRAFLERFSPSAALDIGCGTGRLTKEISSVVETVYACDYSEECVRITTERIPSANISMQDVRDLKYEDGVFSVVVAGRVLQSIPDSKDKAIAISEINRVLQPGGGFLLIEGNADRLTPPPAYNYYLQYNEWQTILEAAGFEILETVSIPMATILTEIDKRSGWVLRKEEHMVYDIVYALDKLIGKYSPGFVSHEFGMICIKKSSR